MYNDHSNFSVVEEIDMKKIRMLSLALIICLLTCVFISCDEGGGSDIGVELPERQFYDITVSFQIKDSSGRTVIDAQNYNYKSHAEPTVLNVVDTYLTVVADWVCKIDKTNTITQIGGMKANKNNGDYWAFVTNAVTDSKTGEVTLKDMSAINLSVEQINKYKSDGKMSATLITDGAEFTVMLFVSED